MSRFLIPICLCMATSIGLAHPVAGDANPADGKTEAATKATPLMNPRPGVYTAGQPGSTEWKSLRKRGITTVVNLRPMKEMGGRDEAKEVRAEGMTYIEVPIFTMQDINDVNAKKLKAALNAANGTPVLVHCASGNRVGGLMALMAAQEENMPAAQALALGKAAGMQSSEARVRELLHLQAAAPMPPAPPTPPAPPAKKD